MVNFFPEIKELLRRVEVCYGKSLKTSSDYYCLSVDIQRKVKAGISLSTIKRICGYVPYQSTPSLATLNSLAQYIEFKDFDAFCKAIKKEHITQSAFFNAKSVDTADLNAGSAIEVAWAPNRYLLLKYLGDFKFRVLEARNSKVIEGDEFSVCRFIMGMPLFLNNYSREGLRQNMFLAGKKGGITLLNLL